jgi:Flp pilus assembly protein TadG
MERSGFTSLLRRDEGAVAATYALALFALVAIAGVGFDYARLAAMDSELQNAADQAALAAVTQLDGTDNAMVRAQAAANNYLANSNSSWVNETRLANDGSGRPITSLTFHFYSDYNSSTESFVGAELDPTDASDNESAAVVEVVVNGREAFYAFTPIVGAISSGNVNASAVAGLEKATCNVPPLMFCAPSGSTTFPDSGDIGKALKLHMKANESEVWAPGNFGFLDIDYSDTPSGNPNTTTGWNSDFLGCAPESPDSRTGSRTPEMRALNTRFDMYGSGTPSCNAGTGDFCPAQDVRRDWVRVEAHNNVQASAIPGLSCNSAGSGTWQEISSLPAASRPPSQALPPDSCFISGSCSSFGDGTWNSTGYMSTVHPSNTISDVPDLDGNGSISRYEVYEWEKGAASRTDPRLLGSTQTLRSNGRYDVNLYCSYSRPVVGTAVVPSATQKDRRLLTVASVNCSGLSGHAPVSIIRWVDMFLLTPADDVAADKSFYAEIVGTAKTPAGDSGFQYYGRNKPVLLR